MPQLRLRLILLTMERREAFKMHLKPGCKEEYRKRHSELWPEVRKVLKEAGVYDYSIYLDEETGTLFAFQKTSGEAGSQDLGSEEAIRKWWHYMGRRTAVLSSPLPSARHTAQKGRNPQRRTRGSRSAGSPRYRT